LVPTSATGFTKPLLLFSLMTAVDTFEVGPLVEATRYVEHAVWWRRSEMFLKPEASGAAQGIYGQDWTDWEGEGKCVRKIARSTSVFA
jgi:hypothetical protein